MMCNSFLKEMREYWQKYYSTTSCDFGENTTNLHVSVWFSLSFKERALD